MMKIEFPIKLASRAQPDLIRSSQLGNVIGIEWNLGNNAEILNIQPLES